MSLGIEEDNKKTDEPDIDIHIIPDTVKTGNYQKRSFTWYMEKPSAKDYFLTVFIFAVCTLIGLLFQKLDFTDTNIVTIYILGVLLTSIVTDGYLCSVAGSFLSVFLFCFFLTEPRMSFQTYAVGYPVTHNANFIRTYRGTCGKAENTCKAFCTACFSYTDFV